MNPKVKNVQVSAGCVVGYSALHYAIVAVTGLMGTPDEAEIKALEIFHEDQKSEGFDAHVMSCKFSKSGFLLKEGFKKEPVTYWIVSYVRPSERNSMPISG